jgi:hypothetical protein
MLAKAAQLDKHILLVDAQHQDQHAYAIKNSTKPLTNALTAQPVNFQVTN